MDLILCECSVSIALTTLLTNLYCMKRNDLPETTNMKEKSIQLDCLHHETILDVHITLLQWTFARSILLKHQRKTMRRLRFSYSFTCCGIINCNLLYCLWQEKSFYVPLAWYTILWVIAWVRWNFHIQNSDIRRCTQVNLYSHASFPSIDKLFLLCCFSYEGRGVVWKFAESGVSELAFSLILKNSWSLPFLSKFTAITVLVEYWFRNCTVRTQRLLILPNS